MSAKYTRKNLHYRQYFTRNNNSFDNNEVQYNLSLHLYRLAKLQRKKVCIPFVIKNKIKLMASHYFIQKSIIMTVTKSGKKLSKSISFTIIEQKMLYKNSLNLFCNCVNYLFLYWLNYSKKTVRAI